MQRSTVICVADEWRSERQCSPIPSTRLLSLGRFQSLPRFQVHADQGVVLGGYLGAVIPMFGDPRLPQRFWNNLLVDPLTGCWVWQGRPDRDGYPNRTSTINYATKERPYRWAYRVLVGPIIGETLNHQCRNKMCCNPGPGHCCEPMSFVDNVRDAKAHTVTCRQGHPYDMTNTHVRRDGRRECKTCMRERVAAQRRDDPEKARAAWTAGNRRRAVAKRATRGVPGTAAETHCRRGHEWTPENTYARPDGSRECRACRKTRNAR